MRRAGPLLVLLLLATCVRANAGVLAGVITDATAQPLRAVSVVAEPTATSTSSLATESDTDGRYALSLPAGTHQFSFRLAGYAVHVARVTVDESGPLARDVTLQLALASSVVVQARTTFRNLAEVGSAFDLVGVATAASVGVVPASQIEERSLLRPADVFERVPGSWSRSTAARARATSITCAASTSTTARTCRCRSRGFRSTCRPTRTAVSDIDYFYASRLPGEPGSGRDDIHFHPMEPRTVRLGLGVRF